MGEMHAQKIVKIVEMALKSRLPLVGIWDGGGQRAHEGVTALGATGELMDRLISCSGRIPMISLVMGPVVGASALAAAIAPLATDPQQIARFRQASRKLAETFLDREKLAAKAVVWLESLAELDPVNPL